MKNRVRFFAIYAKNDENNIVKDFDMYEFLSSFNDKIERDVDSVRKEIDGRQLRCF